MPFLGPLRCILGEFQVHPANQACYKSGIMCLQSTTSESVSFTHAFPHSFCEIRLHYAIKVRRMLPGLE